MLFTAKDKLATALVAAAVAAYVAYAVFGGLRFIQDVRTMAAVGLVFGFASRRIGGREAFVHARAAHIAAIVCVALGFIAFFTENGVVLGVFMAWTLALWLAAMLATTAHVRDLRVPR